MDPRAANLAPVSEESTSVVDVKRMRLRYAGTCMACGVPLAAGTTADYDRTSKTVACIVCPPTDANTDQGERRDPSIDVGSPTVTEDAPAVEASPEVWERPTLEAVDGQGGASAAAEFQRRHGARRDRVLNSYPRMGKFLLAVFDDPQSTKAWSVGAEGERLLSEMLAGMAGESLRVLNDRRIPRTRANIDHLVVCPSGVFVVDAKRYRNARPALKVEGGLIRPRTELLTVAGRDRTTLVTGMQKQLDLVQTALADQPDIPVWGVLCFVEADWPLLGGPFTVNGVHVMSPKKLRAPLTHPGPLDEARIADVQWHLHEAFPRQKQS